MLLLAVLLMLQIWLCTLLLVRCVSWLSALCSATHVADSSTASLQHRLQHAAACVVRARQTASLLYPIEWHDVC
jgi:hypothetical protein